MKLTTLVGFVFLLSYFNSTGQISGYYINWNVDHTQRAVKPSIPIDSLYLSTVDHYQVIFDTSGRFKTAKFFHNGTPSKHSGYGAFQIERIYSPEKFEEIFKNANGERVNDSEGTYIIRYFTDEHGYWIRKEYYDENDQLLDIKGSHNETAAISIISRDSLNRMATEVRLNTNLDTIPDINGFKKVHYGFNSDGFLAYRKQLNEQGKLSNGSLGYAIAKFQCTQNGIFFDEEFRDENHKLVVHPTLKFAKVNFREFDQFGKFRRIYFIDENGYPDESRAYAEIEHYPDSNIKSVNYFNCKGEQTMDYRGIAKIKFHYDLEGKRLKPSFYDIEGNLTEINSH